MHSVTGTRYRPYWDDERETAPPRQRAELILTRLRHQLWYAYETIPLYRELYDAHGFHPDDVQSIVDFTAKVPVLTKEMLRTEQAAQPPFGSHLAVDPEHIVRVFTSCGRTGTPTVYGISENDWERGKQAQAMAVWAMGVRPDDVVHFLFPFSRFAGGWALLLGTTEVGATSFPGGTLDPREHLAMMHRLGSTVLAGTPSHCLHLADVARQTGTDLRALPLHTLMVGGEPGGSLAGTVAALRAAYGDVSIVDTGSTSECFPTQTNSSCTAQTGMHVFEDEVFLEVVDPHDEHRALPDGRPGAAVYTTLWRESQPMIRFWSGDQTSLDRSPCPCGRSYPRLPEGVTGRLGDPVQVVARRMIDLAGRASTA